MRTATVLLVTALLGVVLAGCAGFVWAPVVPPPALVLTSYDAPLDTDLDNTPMDLRKGTSSCINVLGIVTIGDAGVRAAAKDGNISRVHHADYKFFNVLGVFSKYTTVVYGE